MLINEQKELYNNLSEAGKRSTKLNIIFAHSLLNNQLKEKKKYKNKDCLAISAFESSENKNNLDEDEEKEDIDIFSNESENINLKNVKSHKLYKNNNLLKNKIEKNKKKYQYHELHMKNLKKKETINNPSCTKYNPKYESILKGVKSLPLWEKITGRTNPKKEVFEHKFYLQHENIEDTMAGKTFIDMSKQISKRGYDTHESFREKTYLSNSYMNKNLSNLINYNKKYSLTARIKKNSDKGKLSSGIAPYSDISNNSGKKKLKNMPISRPLSSHPFKQKYKYNILNKKKKYYNNSKLENSTNINTSNINNIIDISNNNITNNYNIYNNNNNKNNNNLQKIENNCDSNTSTDSYDLFKHIYIKKKKPKDDSNYCYSNYNSKRGNSFRDLKRIKKHKIKAPDFKKCLSRESLSKIEDNKTAVTPYLLPNYKSVREKPIMMVVYDIKKHKKNRSKSASLLKVDNTYYFDQNKVIGNINNHLSIHPPNFDLMTSRPIDNEPLPSYMKKIFDRNSCYGISAYSLKLNNYRNRDFTSFKSSFWPKISFNKVINLNLLKSKKFLDNIIFEENKKEIKNNLIGKALKFYNKNYEEIFKEDALPKFDNITYKSFSNKKTQKIKELINSMKKE